MTPLFSPLEPVVCFCLGLGKIYSNIKTYIEYSQYLCIRYAMIIVNVVEEAVAEGVFTTVVLQQDHEAAATSCFRVYCSCQSYHRQNVVKT